MRKLLISLAAAGSALAIATPAAAQFYPQPYGGQPYGYNGYGQNNWQQVRQLKQRVDRVEWQINQFDRRGVIGDRRAERLRAEANDIARRLRFAARNGLNPYEANQIRARIDRLEQRVQYSLASGQGRYGYGNGYGYDSNRWVDRDRDGRNDRHEDDRGWDHDD